MARLLTSIFSESNLPQLMRRVDDKVRHAFEYGQDAAFVRLDAEKSDLKTPEAKAFLETVRNIYGASECRYSKGYYGSSSLPITQLEIKLDPDQIAETFFSGPKLIANILNAALSGDDVASIRLSASTSVLKTKAAADFLLAAKTTLGAYDVRFSRGLFGSSTLTSPCLVINFDPPTSGSGSIFKRLAVSLGL